MHRQTFTLATTVLASLLSLIGSSGCRSAGSPAARPDPIARAPDRPNPCLLPVPSGETRGAAAGWGEGFTWTDQHEAINASAAKAAAENRPVDVVLLGDSITQSWGGPGRRVGAPGAAAREKHLGRWDTLNFGISGDRTQHLLWRLGHGNFDGIHPRVVVLLIGTNNITAGDTPEQIAEGVRAVVESLREKLPETRVLLSAVLPRGRLPADPKRAAVADLNRLLTPLGELEHVRYLDPAPVFLDGSGEARADLMAGDFLHLSPAGYDAWGDVLEPAIGGMLQDR